MEFIKYPRTPHLPWSPGKTNDDRVASQECIEQLSDGRELVVTEKMDGGNLTFYKGAFHGRSLDSGTHAWDTRARALWAEVQDSIPEDWRISGESMWARRSIAYENLPSIFLVFHIWDEFNNALSWDSVKEYSELLDLVTVPEIYRGHDFDDAIEAWSKAHNSETSEGFVVRTAGSFSYEDFSLNVAKFVREDHIQTRADWRYRDDFAVNSFQNDRKGD